MEASRETPAPLHDSSCRTSSKTLSSLRARPSSASLLLSGIEIVPVHERVEPERVGALRLPPPERPNREHHDVSLAERGIERCRTIREELPVQQGAGQEHVTRVRRE